MRPLALLHLTATGCAWVAVGYLLGLPLARERARRGDYLFGHYGLLEVYVGLPVLCVALVLSILWLLSPERRRVAMGRVVLATVATLLAVAMFDVGYSLGVRGAWRAQYWLDFAHVSRDDNEADPELGFRRRANTTWTGRVPYTNRVVTYRVDARGFRNPPGVERADVAFVGDSFTEAAQVDDSQTFVRLVSARTGLSVVNLGRGAYGPQQERIVLERYGLDCAPRFVVWQLFDGNDLGDAQEYAAWRSGDYGRASLLRRYLDNSFFRPALEATFESKRGDIARLRLDDGRELPISLRYRWMPEQTEERRMGWRQTEATLRDGIEACRARGIEIAVVFVPVMARVLRDRLSFPDPADAARWAPPDSAAMHDFGAAVRALCEASGCAFIDLYPVFVAAAADRSEGIYIPRNEHLDVRGHALVADAIAAWLESRR